MKKLATIVAASGLALGLSACGSSNDAEKAVEDFAAAVEDQDYAAICDAFDPELVKAMEQGGQDCAKAMEENWDQMDVPADAGVDIQDSEIADDEKTATVTVKNQDDKEEEIPLKKVDDDWKISIDQ